MAIFENNANWTGDAVFGARGPNNTNRVVQIGQKDSRARLISNSKLKVLCLCENADMFILSLFREQLRGRYFTIGRATLKVLKTEEKCKSVSRSVLKKIFDYRRVTTTYTVFIRVSALGPVVQSLDNSIQRINRYPVNKVTPFVVLIG